MTAADRLAAIGADLAEKAPAVVDASIVLLESVARAIDAAQPDHEHAPPGDELREFLCRLLGWSATRQSEVGIALRDVGEMARGHAALILRGEGSLLSIARRLHRLTLPDLRFVVLGDDEQVTEAIDRAAGGMLYVDARAIPRALARLASIGPESNVRLVVSAEDDEDFAKLATMLPRVVAIRIPLLAARTEELDRLIAVLGADAAAALGAREKGFRPHDVSRIRDTAARTLADLEEATRRLVTIRNWGITAGAKRLGISHGALSRWARQHKIPT